MFCQVCLGKWTCFVIFVKYAWWSAVLQNQAKREHVLSSMPGEMPFCQNKPKEDMLCQVCLGKCRIPKTSSKRTCFVIFVTYAWWSAVLQKKLKRTCFVKYAWWNAVFLAKKQAGREHRVSFLSSMLGEMPLCKNKPKENMLCQVCLGKCRIPKTSSKRTCFVIFVTYAWWSAVLQKQTKENMLCQVCLVKCRFSFAIK